MLYVGDLAEVMKGFETVCKISVTVYYMMMLVAKKLLYISGSSVTINDKLFSMSDDFGRLWYQAGLSAK